MSVLCVGSVAWDSVETPFGRADRVLGGSGLFFCAAASLLVPVQLVGVVGDDFPMDALDFLAARGTDLSGIEQQAGESFFWAGRYHFDMNTRDTVETRLGVFADFDPKIPSSFHGARYVFLGNIDPVLQHRVLDQVKRPEVVVCDTMDYWIKSRRVELEALLARVQILMVNDSELRQLAGEANLLKAAQWVRAKGTDMVVVKKGEHGAILFADSFVFFVPGYPLEQVYDPTGAGDAFAGGFVGYLAYVDSVAPDDLRRAMVYGSAVGSFAVEKFSVDRLRDLTIDEVQARVRDFRTMTAFEAQIEVAEGV